MDHPVFGKIDREPGAHWLTGRVRLDFFSEYDVAVHALCAARLGLLPDSQSVPDPARIPGEFSLALINQKGSQPSVGQERAFLQFLDNRDMVCNVVVDAIFDYYQGNWGHWRATAEPGQEYTDELLIPEIHTRNELKRVIRLDGLHVLDCPPNDNALIGFCFDCSWDEEHGLGILVRGGKLVEIGENAITWSAIECAGNRGSPQAPPKLRIDEQHGIAAIKRLGGSVTVDGAQPGSPVVRIDLQKKQVYDADLKSFRNFQCLRQLELDGTRVTDAGLSELMGFQNLEMLQISGTQITDAGLKMLQVLTNLKVLHISSTDITDAGLIDLRVCKALVSLHLGYTTVTDTGLKELCGLTSLQHLDLTATFVTDAGLQEMLKNIKGLISLDLQGTQVKDAGLTELKGLHSLRYLNLSHSNVTDATLGYLKELESLRTVKLQSTATTNEGVADLERALPRLKVFR